MAHTLDITKDHCPMTFVKVKLELSRMNAGEAVEVVMSGGEPFANIPRAAAEQGHRVLDSFERAGVYHVIIEKQSKEG